LQVASCKPGSSSYQGKPVQHFWFHPPHRSSGSRQDAGHFLHERQNPADRELWTAITCERCCLLAHAGAPRLHEPRDCLPLEKNTEATGKASRPGVLGRLSQVHPQQEQDSCRPVCLPGMSCLLQHFVASLLVIHWILKYSRRLVSSPAAVWGSGYHTGRMELQTTHLLPPASLVRVRPTETRVADRSD
jgi:hypothetical protein